VKFINDFEHTAAELAVEKGYQFVICGHIHHPEIKVVETPKGSVTYLNSGDWIENLSSLEYHRGEWSVYRHLEVKQSKYPSQLFKDEAEPELLNEKLDVRKLLALLKAE